MALPIRTTVEDVQAICAYLAKKPTGASLKEAKAVLDSKVLDGRKLSAYKFWGLVEDQDRLKLTQRGREAVRDSGVGQSNVFAAIVRETAPYNAILERAAHNSTGSLTALEVAAHWHDHFKEEVSSNEKILNDQAVCFFQIASGAGLGNLVVGRRGAPTRFEFEKSACIAFADGQSTSTSSREADKDPVESSPAEPFPVDPPGQPKQKGPTELGQGIFIAHGKNRKPLDQLKKILDQFKIPYKVAVEEPNLGRPISAKVRETMQQCNCAILIFTADEEFQDKDGNAIWRPSENVIYELGAAGYLYGNSVVIMKEEDVEFPTNFKDIGYISFSKDQLAAQSMEVLKELIGFGIVKIST